MEVREDNVIVNVDEVLDIDKQRFVKTMTLLLNWVVQEKNPEILDVVVTCMVRAAMVIKMMRDSIGDKNE